MNCKPGDLAIVIYAELTPEMIGAIVKVIRRSVDGEPNSLGGFDVGGLPGWVVEAQSSRGIPLRTLDGLLHMVPWRSIEDRLLRPISGLPMEEETEQKLKEPA